MNRISKLLAGLLLLASAWSASAELPQVLMETSMGNIVLELYPEKSPRTVKNFVNYVKTQYYDAVIFHRVMSGWVIQAGNYDADLVGYETDPPIRNEATNGLKNDRGTIAMAHADDPHSADSQFFINLNDNHSLNHSARTLDNYGFCVFGKVIEGLEVVDAIGTVETHAIQGFENLPVETVLIHKVTMLRE